MKVNAADFSQVEVSQNDKTNVILEGIYNEIRELKNMEQWDYLRSSTTKTRYLLCNSSNLAGNICLFSHFRCKDYETVYNFKTEIVNKAAGLKGLKDIRITEKFWLFRFYFINEEYRNKAIILINEIASRFNITNIANVCG